MWPWYLILDIALWGITLIIFIWSWKRLDQYWKISMMVTIVLVMILQVMNEVLSLNIFKAWTFSDKYNRMLGIDLLGAPIEEYLFWFAFAWMIPSLYSGLAISNKTPKN